MFPNELLNLPNWVSTRNKVPINPKTGENASSQDPATWGSYDEARSRTDTDGVGFVPRSPYLGLDLDHCVIDGQINDYAKEVVRLCNSYTEFSPSGTGIHILLKGELPESRRTDKIELYQNGNYLTFTGNVVYPFKPIREVTKEFLASLIPTREKFIASGNESWVLPALDSIDVNGPYEKQRTPVFLRVIGSLKRRGLTKEETLAFMLPWVEKHEYGIDRIKEKIDDQYQRYPVEVKAETEEDSGSIIEFMKEIKPVKWIIPGVIAEGSINIIAGLGESRKTWIVNDLAISAATGRPWLDKFPISPHTCLMLNQERPKSETQRRFSQLLKAHNVNFNDLEGLLNIRSNTTYRINLQHSFDAFRRYLAKYQPSLICVDSFNTFHSLSEENRGDMQFVFEKIKALRDEFNCAFMFIDHETKAAYKNNLQGDNAEAMISHDKMAGSAVKAEVAEGVFVARSVDDKSSIIYHTKNTFGDKIAPVVVSVTDLDGSKTATKVVGS